MIPAIHPRGDNVGGLLRYLFGPGKHEEHIDPHLVAAWLDAGELNELEPPTAGAGRRDVGWLAQLLEQPVAAARKPPAKTVWHCSIRNHTNDRTLTDAQWRHIAGEVMAAVGLAITYGRLGAARGLHGPRPPLAKWSHVYDAIRHLLATQTTANLASALAALIALAAFWAAVAANRTSRVFLVTEVRREWEDHRGDWATSLLLFRGPDDYYVDASVEERNRIRKLIANAGQDVSDNLGGFSERINMLRAETRTVRRVARFLAYCGRLVLAGRVSVADIYQILGPEVASHGRATRWIAGMEYMDSLELERDSPKIREWALDADQISERSYYAEQEIIASLVDVLWAEMARAGDHDPDSLLRVAIHKSTSGSGDVCKRRIWSLARKHGGIRKAFRLRRQLQFAERIPYSAIVGGNRYATLQVEHKNAGRTFGSARLTVIRLKRATKNRPSSDGDVA